MFRLSKKKSLSYVNTQFRGRSRAAATSKMERWKLLTIITKRSILDVEAALDPPLQFFHQVSLLLSYIINNQAYFNPSVVLNVIFFSKWFFIQINITRHTTPPLAYFNECYLIAYLNLFKVFFLSIISCPYPRSNPLSSLRCCSKWTMM